MTWRSPSIIRRLVLVTVVAGLITGALGVLVVQAIERRSLLADADERNRANAVRTAALVDSRIDALGDQLALVASRPAVTELSETAGDPLAAALRVAHDLDRLIVYRLDGTPVAGAAASSLVRVDDVARWDLADDIDTDRTVRLLADEGDHTVEIAVAVEDPPGQIVGWLVGQTPAELLTAEAVSQVAGPGASVAVVAPDGTIVAHRETDRVVQGEVLAVDELFPGDQRVARTERSGSEVLVAAAQLRTLPGWVVAEQPMREALIPVQAVTGALTGVFLAVIAAIVLVVILAGRRLLRPLEPLAEAVERVGAGERGVRVDTAGSGEVGIVTAGFNRMASSLEERQDDLQRAEIATRRSEERLRLMVEGVSDYAIVLLDPDGLVRTWNTGAHRLVELTPADALGRPLSDVFDPDEPPPDPLIGSASTGRAVVEGWCRRADGRRFWASITATSLVDDEGAPYGYAVILHDQTARHAAREATEAALQRERQAAAELRQANELKDEFLSIAAHEIRTPLSVILGASRLLGREGARLGDEDASRVRSMIESHADDLRSIVDRLLEFTRLQAGKVVLDPEPLQLRAELQAHVRSLGRHVADHDVEVDVEDLTLVVDRAALRHIVTNLVSNAAKFSPAGSAITLRAQRRADGVELAVVDEGVGVPAEDREVIFELFRQASREVITARGTGVGLAIVKRYVELLDGRITLDSTPHRGSTFTVHLPDKGT